jgi:ATP-dependent Clp protease ATP-binding subunit ClpB
MTSNLGSQFLSEAKNYAEAEVKVMEKVRSFFKPEFINRIDGIVMYNPLSKEIMEKIVDLQLQETQKRLEKQEFSITVTDKAKKHLLEVGFDEMYGARPLKRVINELIVDEIALQLLEGKIKKNARITVDYKNNRIQISSKSIH